MASGKRDTDPGKWDKKWFRKLSIKHKTLWFFLCDKCDWAGVWEPDFDLAEFQIGEAVGPEDMNAFGDKLQQLENGKYWLSGFIDYQQGGRPLNWSNNAHKGILRSIEKNAVPYASPSLAPNQPLISPSAGAGEPPCNVTVTSCNVDVKEGGPGETAESYIPAFRSIRPEFANVPEFGITNALASYDSKHWKPAFDEFAADMANTLPGGLPKNPSKLFAGYLRTIATGKRGGRNAERVTTAADINRFRKLNAEIEEAHEA